MSDRALDAPEIGIGAAKPHSLEQTEGTRLVAQKQMHRLYAFCELLVPGATLSQVMLMMRAVFATAAIVFGATVTVTPQDRLGGCCTSAHAQTQTASTEPTIWDHNGSVMYLVENGSSREFWYRKPRLGMLEAGAHPGSLLFRGQIDDKQFSGTAYIFNSQCGRIPFEVTGSVVGDGERIILTGRTPQVGRDCRTYGSSNNSTLEFRRLDTTEAGSLQESLVEAIQAEGVEQFAAPSKTEEAVPAPGAVTEPKVTPSAPIVALPATNRVLSVPKDLDNFIWAATLIAVVLAVCGAATLATPPMQPKARRLSWSRRPSA